MSSHSQQAQSLDPTTENPNKLTVTSVLKQTSQSTRQLQLWWKHNVRPLSNRADRAFDGTNTGTTTSTSVNAGSSSFARQRIRKHGNDEPSLPSAGAGAYITSSPFQTPGSNKSMPSSSSLSPTNAALTTERQRFATPLHHRQNFRTRTRTRTWTSPYTNTTNCNQSAATDTPGTHPAAVAPLTPSDSPQVATIDQALAALTTYSHLFTPKTKDESDHDWILDGHPVWQNQYSKTQALLEQLYPPSFFQPHSDELLDDNPSSATGSATTNSNTVKHMETWLQQLEDEFVLQRGSYLGQQEFQFASFGANEDDTNGENTTAILPEENENAKPRFDVNWAAEFEMTTTTEPVSPTKEKEEQVDSDDKELETPLEQAHDNTTAAKELIPENNGGDHINDEDERDDDDFGDFQDASGTLALNAPQSFKMMDRLQSPEPTHSAIPTQQQAVKTQDMDRTPLSNLDSDSAETGQQKKESAKNHSIRNQGMDRTPLSNPSPCLREGGSPNSQCSVESTSSSQVLAEEPRSIGRDDSPNRSHASDNSHPLASPPRNDPTQKTDNEANPATKLSLDTVEELRPAPDEEAVMRTPQPSIYFATPEKAPSTRDLPKTPTTNNYSQSKQEKPKSRTRLFADESQTSTSRASPESTENQQLMRDPMAVLGEDADDGSHALSSRGDIPSVVQLFSRKEDSLIIPSTIQLTGSKENDQAQPNRTSPSYRPSSLHQGSKQLIPGQKRSIKIPLERQTSLTSQNSNSINSPEGRFLRRHLSSLLHEEDSDDEYPLQWPADNGDENATHSTNESRQDSLASLRSVLPEAFLGSSQWDENAMQNKADAEIVQVLSSLEWEWIPYWQLDHLLEEEGCDESFVPLWLEELTVKLSTLDASHIKVCKKLHHLIQPHKENLQVANESALDLAKNLQLCQMYLERSKKSIGLAKYGRLDIDTGDSVITDHVETDGAGVAGAQQLLDWWDAQRSYQDFRRILSDIQEQYEMEADILSRIEILDIRLDDSLEECESIVQLIHSLEGHLTAPLLARVDCLGELRKRAQDLQTKSLVLRLHEWLESLTIRASHAGSISAEFNASEYERLVQSFFIAMPLESGGSMTEGFVKSFCTSVHTALLLEAQKSFGMSLLNPSGADHEDSEYERELLALSTNAYASLEPSRISSWTHNLVTIRFDFEIAKNPLPAVFHKLCSSLTNIIYGQYRLLEWHRQNYESNNHLLKPHCTVLRKIYEEMRTRRCSIWNSTVKVLEECLEEYLKFASKKKLFPDGNPSIWYEDLLGLEDVLSLIDQFLSLRKEFLDDVSNLFVNDGAMLREHFYNIQKKHLRGLHVESMNRMGMALYQEDWMLVPLPQTLEEKKEDSHSFEEAVVAHLLKCRLSSIDKSISRFNMNNNPGRSSWLESFEIDGSPFSLSSKNEEDDTVHTSLFRESGLDSDVLKLLNDYVGAAESKSFLIPSSIVNDIIPWLSRLMLVWEKLPPISEEAFEVCSNISDLYLTTAFRLCSGNGSNEKIILGLERCKSPLDVESSIARSQEQPPGMFPFSRRSSLQVKAGTQTSQNFSMVEADVCSPMLQETVSSETLRQLILNAQEALKDIAKIDLVNNWIPDPSPINDEDTNKVAKDATRVLEKRVSAAWGCIFLYVALEKVQGFVQTLLVQEKTDQRYGLSMSKMTEYVHNMKCCLPYLVKKCVQIACSRAVTTGKIVKKILDVGTSWEEPRLHEHPNDYVDETCHFLRMMWHSLLNECRLPVAATSVVWRNLVECAYAAMLDGFARVPFCSTEGRALMSMDVSTFASGLADRSAIGGPYAGDEPPPQVTSNWGQRHVDTFIKIFYFPPTDAFAWIEENFQGYHRNHMIALIVGSTLCANEIRDVISEYVTRVEGLYAIKQGNATVRRV